MNASTQQKHESLFPQLPTPDSRLPTFKIGLLKSKAKIFVVSSLTPHHAQPTSKSKTPKAVKPKNASSSAQAT
ncbi:MAG TPA: hypothetical protein DCE56_30105 [Cyanobacteria bacterium UBA8553]|nr:hypothetical protein [Cyanobacteria bacterium UBA8553]HAJ62785.1 hypothetical protein [Cyanobacteria bacterium UBA8543]